MSGFGRNTQFIHKGRGQSASGQALQTLTITRADGDTHQFEAADRESRYKGVRTYWDDTVAAERQCVIVGEAEAEGEEATLRTLRDPYPTQGEAIAAAQGEWGRLQRAQASMRLTLAHGRPDIMPEQPAVLSGWKAEIDALDWLVTEVQHDIGDSGYTTSVDFEVRSPES